MGMELAAGAAPRCVITRDIPAVLKSLAGRPRLYPDALAARAVEGQHGLPLAEVFDDLRIMGSLLEVPPPQGPQQLAAMLLDNSVDSVERTGSADRRRPDDPNSRRRRQSPRPACRSIGRAGCPSGFGGPVLRCLPARVGRRRPHDCDGQ